MTITVGLGKNKIQKLYHYFFCLISDTTYLDIKLRKFVSEFCRSAKINAKKPKCSPDPGIT